MSLVWAKLKYCAYWPAKVIDVPEQIKHPPKNKTCVLFFGSKQIGFVEKSNIHDYVQHRAKYSKKGRGFAFKEAIDQMEQFINDPIKNGSHTHFGSALTVMSEKTAIKFEHNDDEGNFIELNTVPNQTANQPGAPASDTSENKLINELLTVRAENKTLYFNSRKQAEAIDALKSTAAQRELNFTRRISALEEIINVSRKETTQKDVTINSLKATIVQKDIGIQIHTNELQKARQKAESALETQKASIAEILLLKRKNNELRAKVSQLQSNLSACHGSRHFAPAKSTLPPPASGKRKSGEYEVERIISHKMVKKTQHFLIRWKGFDETFDTWEKETNLSCPLILSAYLKSAGQ